MNSANRTNPELSIVVLTSVGGKDDVLECLGSLDTHSDDRIEVLVVDNASVDGTSSAIAVSFPKVRVIRHDRNLGYSRGMQSGIDASSAPYVWLLNNDLTLEPGAAHRLLDRWLGVDNGVAAIFPRVVYYEQPDRIQTFGCVWFPQGRFVSRFAPLANATPIFGDIFVAPSFRRESLRSAGGFDAEFTMGAEDFDMSYRLNFLGFNLLGCPDVIVRHKVSRSVRLMAKGVRDSMTIVKYLQIFIRYYEPLHLAVYLPWAVARLWLFRGLVTALKQGRLRDVPKYLAVPLILARQLPTTVHERRVWQALRRRSDREIWRLGRDNDEAAWAI